MNSRSLPKIVILMGVTCCGKTTVGTLLAQELGWQFLDADDLHPKVNVDKMRQGIPLSDEDRLPWLKQLKCRLHDSIHRGESVVLACSSLKSKYRMMLSTASTNVAFVYLRASEALLAARLAARKGHFMAPRLLPSQLATLEEPIDAFVVDASLSPREIVSAIKRHIGVKG
jgi:gluconokinase